jgi:hypothetical protein
MYLDYQRLSKTARSIGNDMLASKGGIKITNAPMSASKRRTLAREMLQAFDWGGI